MLFVPFYQIEGEELEEDVNDADSEPEEEEIEEESTSGESDLRQQIYIYTYY